MAKMTTDDFVAKAKEIHGDKYDYSLVDMTMVNSVVKDKVCIICPEHGPFWKTPQHHLLRKQGCPQCAVPNAHMDTETFILKARKIHNNKYSYPNTVYTKSHAKVKIVCPIHGEFEQEAHIHLDGHGCPKCAKVQTASKKKTGLDKLVERAQNVHNFKYDYSETEYVDANTSVRIICPKHGAFKQKPGNHLKGHGCPKCSVEERSASKKAKRLPFRDAEIAIRQLGIKDQGEYRDRYDSELKSLRFPKNPQTAYKNEGWVSWPKFLGNERKITEYVTYDEAKEYVNSLGLTSIKEWRDLCDNDKIPYHIPHYPESTYKNKGWVGYDDWLGDSYKSRYREFYTYEEAKAIIHGFNLKSVEDFYELIRQDKLPYRIPRNPHQKYVDEWECWQVFLGYDGGFRKGYKFNLLQEFEDEYAFRAFLANNDINILQVILRNVEPKYEPLKRDIERALSNASSTDPIEALEQKYSKESEDEATVEDIIETPTHSINNIDLDDDDVVNSVLNSELETDTDSLPKTEPTIEDVVQNNEQELRVINRIEHMLTPEDREYIMEKFLNDKRRVWMAERENKLHK